MKARSVVLNFTPGPSGRAPILSYTVEYNNDSFYDPVWSQWKILMIVQDAHLVWDLLPITLLHLKPYTDYRFRVIAANKVGSSSPSNTSDPIKTLEAGKETVLVIHTSGSSHFRDFPLLVVHPKLRVGISVTNRWTITKFMSVSFSKRG